MAVAAAFVAVAVLAIVVFDVIKSGASALNLDFLIQDPPAFGGPAAASAPPSSDRRSSSRWRQ